MPRRHPGTATSSSFIVSQRPKNSSVDFPPAYASIVHASDQYSQSINLKPSIWRFPLPDDIINQLCDSLEMNNSFVKSQCNPNPPIYDDPELIDASPIEAHLAAARKSLRDGRQGLLVMLYKPPDGVDLTRPSFPIETPVVWQPVCGVVVRVGGNEIDAGDPSECERAITQTFLLPYLPEAVARPVMQVALARAILEIICFEEVALRDDDYRGFRPPPPSEETSTPVRNQGRGRRKRKRGDDYADDDDDSPFNKRVQIALNQNRRFISFDKSDLLLGPTIVSELIKSGEMNLSAHVQGTGVKHEDRKNCQCLKKFQQLRNRTAEASNHCRNNGPSTLTNGVQSSTPFLNGNSSSSATSSPGESEDSRSSTDSSHEGQQKFYRFFMLAASRLKGLVGSWVPRKVDSVGSYFRRSVVPALNGVGSERGHTSSIVSSSRESTEWNSDKTSSQDENDDDGESSEEQSGTTSMASSEEEEKPPQQQKRRYRMRERDQQKHKREKAMILKEDVIEVEFDRCSRSTEDNDDTMMDALDCEMQDACIDDNDNRNDYQKENHCESLLLESGQHHVVTSSSSSSSSSCTSSSTMESIRHKKKKS